MDVAILGGGNLGCAIAKALVRRYGVVVTRRNVDRIRFLEDLGCSVTNDNVLAVKNSDIVFLTVKPSSVFDVLSEVREHLEDKILVSFVAGLRIDELRRLVSCKIVRAMTNISAEIGRSITAYYTEDLKEGEIFELELILERLGDVVRVEREDMLDAMTAYSSAVAFLAKIYQSFVYAGLKLGLSFDLATKVTSKVFKGTADLLELESPESIIERVTTPAGTTVEGLMKLMEHRVDYGIMDAMVSSFRRLKKE